MIPLILFFACASSEKENSDTQEDTLEQEDTAETTEPVDPSTLNGIPPEQEKPLTEFRALNSDGSTRNESNINGSPTVMWFFPAADTPG